MALTKENITRELLERVATDLNKTILDAESAILIEGVVENALRADVLEVGEMLVPDDKPGLRAQTKEALGALGIELFIEKEEENPIKKEEGETEADKAQPEKEKLVESEAPKEEAPKTTNKKNTPGVIASILEFIQKASAEGINIKEISDKLAKRFPDRKIDAMTKTIKAQIGGKKSPCRMEKEKKVKFNISDGRYSVS